MLQCSKTCVPFCFLYIQLCFDVFACCSVAKSTVFFPRNWASLGQCLINNLVGFIAHTWQPAKQTRFVEGEQEFQRGMVFRRIQFPCFPLTAHAQLLYEKHYIMMSPRRSESAVLNGGGEIGGGAQIVFKKKQRPGIIWVLDVFYCVSLFM